MIIYLEGPDGSGKSTLAEAIYASLKDADYKVMLEGNQLVPTHPLKPGRLNEKQLFAMLKNLAKNDYIYIVDGCVISDIVYRIFDDYKPVTILPKVINFLKQYESRIITIYCHSKSAEQKMLERGDENPIALSRHKEISKVYDLVMSEVANSLKRNFVNYDLTKKGQMNTIISSILYWAFLLLGGK